MQKTFAEIIEAMGGTRAGDAADRRRARPSQPGGYIIHEVGGAIMGSRSEEVGDATAAARPGT